MKKKILIGSVLSVVACAAISASIAVPIVIKNNSLNSEVDNNKPIEPDIPNNQEDQQQNKPNDQNNPDVPQKSEENIINKTTLTVIENYDVFNNPTWLTLSDSTVNYLNGLSIEELFNKFNNNLFKIENLETFKKEVANIYFIETINNQNQIGFKIKIQLYDNYQFDSLKSSDYEYRQEVVLNKEKFSQPSIPSGQYKNLLEVYANESGNAFYQDLPQLTIVNDIDETNNKKTIHDTIWKNNYNNNTIYNLIVQEIYFHLKSFIDSNFSNDLANLNFYIDNMSNMLEYKISAVGIFNKDVTVNNYVNNFGLSFKQKQFKKNDQLTITVSFNRNGNNFNFSGWENNFSYVWNNQNLKASKIALYDFEYKSVTLNDKVYNINNNKLAMPLYSALYDFRQHDKDKFISVSNINNQITQYGLMIPKIIKGKDADASIPPTIDFENSWYSQSDSNKAKNKVDGWNTTNQDLFIELQRQLRYIIQQNYQGIIEDVYFYQINNNIANNNNVVYEIQAIINKPRTQNHYYKPITSSVSGFDIKPFSYQTGDIVKIRISTNNNKESKLTTMDLGYALTDYQYNPIVNERNYFKNDKRFKNPVNTTKSISNQFVQLGDIDLTWEVYDSNKQLKKTIFNSRLILRTPLMSNPDIYVYYRPNNK